ncbi:response regulator [Occallatibacter savannae]|uniref:response regulator n=1 Tax=Occallatibacter savannae TaxID=1002691 RepID=UPI000D698B64|nr:response regulator [Occallatibacter savannae]
MCAADCARKPRVLVADDEKIIADTLKLILTGAGYEVSVAYDGIAALERAKERSPDLLLSDVFMPGLSGIDLAIQVCDQLPTCKVLLMSGQANLEFLRHEIKSKCREFEVLSKPTHPTDLLAQIGAMLPRGSGVRNGLH